MIFYTLLNEENAAPRYAYQHEAAYKLLSTVLKKTCEIENYLIERRSHGKPYLADRPDVFFNLSHCCGLAVCGLSDKEIGVDCELIRPYSGKAARKIFSAREIDLVLQSEAPDEIFFRIWTLKEALGKAFGTGLFSDLKKYEFDFENGVPFCRALPEKSFTQKVISNKWIVSVCSDEREKYFEEI